MILDAIVSIGRDASFGPASGVSSDWEWWSEPIDLGPVDNWSIQINPLTEAPIPMLFVPSTSDSPAGKQSRIGILYVAKAAGVSTVTITHSAPSGSATTVSVSTDDITVAPAAGATNETVAALVNQNASASALVTAYPVGWEPCGPILASFQSDIESLARQDVVLAFSKTALGNNAAAAAQSGTATLEVSNDLQNWLAAGDPNASASISAPGGTVTLTAQNDGRKAGRLHWKPNTGSLGQLSGLVSGKGAAR